MILKDYIDLVTSEYAQQPNFISTLSFNLTAPIRVQDLLTSMIPIFDLDTAVGDQLDVLGAWAGISRNVSIPIANIYFSWDRDPFIGWDFGIWQPNLSPTTITTLPDEAYRTLIRAKIAANNWDGTTEGAYAIWDSIFPQTQILIQDHEDMSYALALFGGMIDALTVALLTGGYIPLKPEGVHVNVYYVSTGTGPIFGFDVESSVIQGWDEGSWVRELAPS